MFEGILLAITGLIEEIYTADQQGMDRKFVILLDELEHVIKNLEKSGHKIDVSKEISQMGEFYVKRDLSALSDYLQYEFQPFIYEQKNIVDTTNMEG